MRRHRRYNTHKKEEEKEQLVQGVVTEALPNALFRVSLQQAQQAAARNSDTAENLEGNNENGPEIKPEAKEVKSEPILAYLAGNMRLHRIRVLVGDKVLLKLDSYGGKGRITKRL